MLIWNIKWLGFVLLLVLGVCVRRFVLDKLVKFEKWKISELIYVMDSILVVCLNLFYIKIKCYFFDINWRVSFKIFICLIKDSIINLIIIYVGIFIVNFIIRCDFLFIINWKDKCVICIMMSYIKELFGVDFDYCNIEELLFGLFVVYDII